MRTSKFIALAAVIAIGALAGCSSSSSSGGGLPGIPTVRLWADGGHALLGPTQTNGGHAGSITLDAGRDVVIDPNRAFTPPATNFLQPALDVSSTISYAALFGLGSGSEAGGVATFNITQGFVLPAGATLDLSDAVPGTVDNVTIISDANIIVHGTIILTRGGADAVNFSLLSGNNLTTTILFTGHVDGRGASPRDGGDFQLRATGTGSGIIFRGSANVSGGPGSASEPGGDAGSILIAADGDLVLREFGAMARGGDGLGSGGDGGFFGIFSGERVLSDIRWGGDVSGGNGGSGNGGNGGGIELVFQQGLPTADANRISSRMVANGGDSVQGSGGDAGEGIGGIEDEDAELTGTLYVIADGGVSDQGSGGDGGRGELLSGSLVKARLVGTARGGLSTMDDGGHGGRLQVLANNADDLLLTGNVSGGHGEEDGGDGGRLRIMTWPGTPSAPMMYDNVRIIGSANGGNGANGDGGDGGQVRLSRYWGGSSGEDFIATNCVINVSANGGNGFANGGSGFDDGSNTGSLYVRHLTGSIEVRVNFSANGGNAEDGDGGSGGSMNFRMDEGHLDVTINSSSLNGGNGFDDGGSGGWLRITPNDNSSNPGSAMVRVNSLNMRGGSAEEGWGGWGGQIELYCGEGTAGDSFFTATSLNIDARGGDSLMGNGGGGGELDTYFRRNASISGGSLNLSGGSGATVSGTGTGGDGGYIDVLTTQFAIIWATPLTANGGNSRGAGADAGKGGDMWFGLNNNSSSEAGALTLTGSHSIRGGNALGNADGGAIGYFWVWDNSASSGGNVTINASVNASGGSAGPGGDGGAGYWYGYENFGIEVNGNIDLGSGTMTFNGGGGGGTTNGADGSDFYIYSDSGNLDINNTMLSIGGNGQSASGDGGYFTIGDGGPTQINILSGARIRANGGVTGAIGDAGFIDIDASGSGGVNVDVNSNAILETRDGDTTDQSATNVTID